MILQILILCIPVAYGDVSDYFAVKGAALEKIQTGYANCLAETKVDPVLLKNVEMGQFASEADINCFYGCYLLSDNAINMDGVIGIEHLKETFSPKVHGILDYCKLHIGGKDCCSIAYEMYKCFVTETLKAKHRK